MVNAAQGPRVTFANTLDSEIATFKHAESAYGGIGVVRTGGVELATRRAREHAQRPMIQRKRVLIEPNHPLYETSRKVTQTIHV